VVQLAHHEEIAPIALAMGMDEIVRLAVGACAMAPLAAIFIIGLDLSDRSVTTSRLSAGPRKAQRSVALAAGLERLIVATGKPATRS
jgi:hypothetical protein